MTDDQKNLTELYEAIAESRPKSLSGDVALGEGNYKTIAEKATSQTVLALDRWGVRRGVEIAQGWREQAVVDHDPHEVADAHGALFEPEVRFHERPFDEDRSAWYKQFCATPEYQALHAQTCLESALSELAAKAVCDNYCEHERKDRERRDREPAGRGEEPKPGSDEEPLAQVIERLRSTQRAVEAASKDVATARDVAAGLGQGEAGQPLDPRALAGAFRKVRDNPTLRAIFEQAGRFRSLCRSLQRRKTLHGVDDVVGVELSGDVGRLLPVELASVVGAISELEILGLHRLATRTALSREQRGTEQVARGPIVCVVDESGSMGYAPGSGPTRAVQAKGFALALCWLARHQRRWIALVGFSGGTDGNCLVLPPGPVTNDAALFGWLEHNFGGGTDCDVPLKELPQNYWPEFVRQGLRRGKTDVILISDGVVDVPTEVRDAYHAWVKAEQVKTYAIVLGFSAGGFDEVSDHSWCVESLALDGEAVEKVLSI